MLASKKNLDKQKRGNQCVNGNQWKRSEGWDTDHTGKR